MGKTYLQIKLEEESRILQIFNIDDGVYCDILFFLWN